MPRLNREREVKLALLEALASSQRAVARMLESTADLNARFPGERPEDMSAMLARLAGLQLRMCESLLGVKLRRVMRGRPAEPWLMDGRLRVRSMEGEPAPVGSPELEVRRHPDAPCGEARARTVKARRRDRRSDSGIGVMAAGTSRHTNADLRSTDGREPV